MVSYLRRRERKIEARNRPRRAKCPSRPLTREQRERVKRLLAMGVDQAAIAERMGKTRRVINLIANEVGDWRIRKQRNGAIVKVNREGKAAILSSEDEANLFVSFKEDRMMLRNQALFVLGINTGLRINELRMLSVGQVMDEDGAIKSEFQLLAKHTKTKKPRTAFINKYSYEALLPYLVWMIEHGFDAQDAPLFITITGKRLSRSMCSRIFEIGLRRAKITGASTHSMRRSFITRLHDKGAKLGVIRDLAGHSSLAQTSQYIDVTDEAKRAAVMAL